MCNTWRPVNTLRFVKSEEFPFNHACKEYLMLLVAFWDYEHTMLLAQDHGMQNQNNKTHWLLLITICHEYTLPKTKKRGWSSLSDVSSVLAVSLLKCQCSYYVVSALSTKCAPNRNKSIDSGSVEALMDLSIYVFMSFIATVFKIYLSNHTSLQRIENDAYFSGLLDKAYVLGAWHYICPCPTKTD